ncbi:MAG TPA: GTPase domain-containing protein, partial [Rudaea sp.]
MAVIDPQRDAVVIRIVYDGPPLAGKTTSVRALARGLGGDVVAPEEIGGRTLYFDWLDYTGGLFEGRRIRCQIITVPGQATLASRRRRLLESADAVVFVDDSAEYEQRAAQHYLEGLRAVLEGVGGPPIGIVLQANKRDLPNAVPLERLRAMLDRVGGRIALIESSAKDGAGVRETFVFAVRLALDRARELMRLGQLHHERPAIDSADDLLAQLRSSEGQALDLAAHSGLIHTRLQDIYPTPSLAAQAVEQAVRENARPPMEEAQVRISSSAWLHAAGRDRNLRVVRDGNDAAAVDDRFVSGGAESPANRGDETGVRSSASYSRQSAMAHGHGARKAKDAGADADDGTTQSATSNPRDAAMGEHRELPVP